MSSPKSPDQSKEISPQEDIAIIGMACLFPGAPDLPTYWQNIVSKVDAVTDPPPEAWDPDTYYDSDSTDEDRVYCKRGGYLGPLARFDPLRHAVMPTAVEGSEPDQWLALQLAHDALADAGYQDSPCEACRTAVILGKGTYLNRGNLNMVQRCLMVDQTLEILKTLIPELSDVNLKSVKRELRECLPPFNIETAAGLIPNVIAGRIANHLNLMGPAYTVDGACASSLLAIEIAVHDLLAKKIDLALVGGAQVSTPVPVLGLFCQLNAVSRRQQIRPFDKDADGTILGEGIGMIVLKRRADAERDGNRIYALIKGVGSSSDGRGLSVLAPRAEGAELALRRSFEMAGISPRTIGLIEAHGTATPAGDMAEIQALTQVFGPRNSRLPWCGLGSVKSMISHTMPAAGIAGIIKAALSLYHKVLPPTLNVDEPNPKFELEKTPFYINTETRPWIHGSNEASRRAGVNAFGFGGINAHVILEECPIDNEASARSYHEHWESEVCILEARSRSALIDRLQHLQKVLSDKPPWRLKDVSYSLNTDLKGEPYRLALVTSSLNDLQEKLEKAIARLENPNCKRIKDVKGIYFFEQPLSPEGKIAFLFPGEGAQYVNMLSDLCIHFPELRACFDRMDRIFSGHKRGYLPSDFIFPPPAFSEAERKQADEKLWKMDGAIEAVLTANEALLILLEHLQIRPVAILGHSTGEYSAMRASGIFTFTDGSDDGQRVLEINQIYEQTADKSGIPHALLIAVGADSASVAALIDQIDAEIYVGMDNCPHQTVIVGVEAEIQKAVDELNRQGIIYQTLPFDRPYHTPLFEAYAKSLRQFFERCPVASPTTQIYSCTTTGPYPDDPDEIRKLMVEHWLRPVEFRKTIERMYEDGIRIFLEVGPTGNLTTFVNDILRGRNYIAFPTNVQHRSGITQINHMVGILAAHGVAMRLDYLYTRRMPRRISFDQISHRNENDNKPKIIKKIATGCPGMRISNETAQQLRSLISHQQPDAAVLSSDSGLGDESFSDRGSDRQVLHQDSPAQIMSAYFENMEHFLDVQQDIIQVFLGTRGEGLPQPSTAPSQSEASSFGLSLSSPVDKVEIQGIRDQGTCDDLQRFDQKLLEIVSQKTGYPKEMLDLNLDMEADLGIDSIKRIEILGTFSGQHGLTLDQNMEQVAGLKTLQQVIDFLGSHIDGHGGSSTDPVQNKDEFHASPFPFMGEVVSLVPGSELVAHRRLTLDEDLYLRDHTLGGKISTMDETSSSLPVMPLAMSLEILAEAGAMLVPDNVLIGIKNIRTYRWIALEDSSVTLQIVARRTTGAGNEVEVEVKINTVDEGEAPSDTPAVEGTAVFAAKYPEPRVADDFSLSAEKPSGWTPERLYTDGMFHGPCWQGVSSIDRCGEDGAVATLKVLPPNGFFSSKRKPGFVLDPIVLDAAGQIVGFWTKERLETGYIVFPFRVKTLRIFRPQLPENQKIRCQARIQLIGAQQVRSDIDMIGEDGQLWMRLEAWEDKRFDLPAEAYAFLLSPINVILSTRWDAPIGSHLNSSLLFRFRSETLFKGDDAFWKRVFAHLVLNRNERRTFRNLGKSEKRRTEWLSGRVVAKDAVRVLLKQLHGIELGPADVEIGQDEHGRPVPQGAWAREIDVVPALSLAHTGEIAVAIAGHLNSGQGIGIDIERIRPLEQEFETTAFTPEEKDLLDSVDESARQQWVIRFWCAKEALAKALGRGLIEGPQGLAVQQLNVRTGDVKIALQGKLAQEFPKLSKSAVVVHTAQEENYIVACTVCERNEHVRSE